LQEIKIANRIEIQNKKTVPPVETAFYYFG